MNANFPILLINHSSVEGCAYFQFTHIQVFRIKTGPRFDPWVGKIPLEKEMATHFSILAWRIPWTENPGGLQSTGSQKSRIQLSN